MAYKDLEKKKITDERYRQNHLEQIRVYSRRYAKEHKVERAIYAKQYYTRLKSEVLNHYSNGQPRCLQCGIDDMDVLCIDHINDGGGQHRRILNCNFYRWLKKEGYPRGYQVLCANCNLKKRFRGKYDN